MKGDALDRFATATGPCVYLAHIPASRRYGSIIKIGMTSHVGKRLLPLADCFDCDVTLLAVIPGGGRAQESALLRRFHRHLVLGMEHFRDVPEIREFIATLPAEHRPADLVCACRSTRHGHPGQKWVAGCADCDMHRRRLKAWRATWDSNEEARRTTPRHRRPAAQVSL